MTHDELLESLNFVWSTDEPTLDKAERLRQALRAVVEKHMPFTPEFGGGDDYCFADDRLYPCPTIQAITEELK